MLRVFMACCLPVGVIFGQSPRYASELVMTSGSGTPSIQAVRSDISCNDKGESAAVCSFLDPISGGLTPGVFVADRSGAVRLVTPSITAANQQTLGDGVFLTEGNSVLVRRTELVPAPTAPIPFSYVDRFDTTTGARTNVVTAAPLVAQYNGIRGHIGASSSGHLIFCPFIGAQHSFATISPAGMWNVNIGWVADPPLMSESQNYVFRRNGSTISVVAAASYPSLVLWDQATGAGGFTNLTAVPGISDQGYAVAFGADFAGAPSVHVACFDDTITTGNPWRTFLVAGGAGGNFNSIDYSSRTGVVSVFRDQSVGSPYRSSTLLTIVFEGTYNPPGGTSSTGVFAVDALVSRGSPTAPLTLVRGNPIPVLEIGQLVSGQSIADVHLYDSVNRAGEVHSRVTLQNGGTGVVRSSRLLPPLRRLRVAAHRVLGSNTQPHPDQGWHQVLDGLHRARAILATANIDLLVVQVSDTTDPSPGTPATLFPVAPANFDAAATTAQSVAAFRNDAINVFFTDISGSQTGNAGFPRGFGPASRTEVVFVDAEPDPVKLATTIAHECGHYLGLLHTFDTVNGPETGPGFTGWPQGWDRAPNAAVAGDLIADTLPDPNSVVSAALWYGAPPNADYVAVAKNLMTSTATYMLTRDRVTTGQGVRMHQAISLARTSTIEGDSMRDCVFRAAPCGSSPALWFTPLRIGSVNDIWGLDLTPGSIFLLYASLFTNAALQGPCLIHLDVPTLVAGPYAFPTSRTQVFQWALPANTAYLGLQFNFQGVMTGGTGVSGLDLTNGVSVTVGQ